MDEVLKAIGGNPKDVVKSAAIQKAGNSYYTWELNNSNTKCAPLSHSDII